MTERDSLDAAKREAGRRYAVWQERPDEAVQIDRSGLGDMREGSFVAGARWGMIQQLRDGSAGLRSAWQQWGDSNDLTHAEALDARADALIEEQERESVRDE